MLSAREKKLSEESDEEVSNENLCMINLKVCCPLDTHWPTVKLCDFHGACCRWCIEHEMYLHW